MGGDGVGVVLQCAEDQEAMLEESSGPVYDAKQPVKAGVGVVEEVLQCAEDHDAILDESSGPV
jgi:hypothetical protein